MFREVVLARAGARDHRKMDFPMRGFSLPFVGEGERFTGHGRRVCLGGAKGEVILA
jgi:hypothetical protein